MSEKTDPAPSERIDSTWVLTWHQTQGSSGDPTGPSGAILRKDIQRFQIRSFKIGITYNNYEVIAYTEGDNHKVSKARRTLEETQADLKELTGTAS